MTINSPQTFNTAAQEYLKNRHRSTTANLAFYISYGIAIGLFLSSQIHLTTITPYSWPVLLAIASIVVSLLIRIRYRNLAIQALPSVEQRALVFIQPAVRNLAALIQHGSKSYRKASLKNLEVAANMIDIWSAGNLRWPMGQLSIRIGDFKNAFRYRLIPAIRLGDRETTTRIHGFLATIGTPLISGVTPAQLDNWNNFLSGYTPHTPTKMFTRIALRTISYNVIFLLAIGLAAYEYYSFLRNTVGASVDTATNGLNAVLGIGLTPYVAYWVWKYISRERGTKGP